MRAWSSLRIRSPDSGGPPSSTRDSSTPSRSSADLTVRKLQTKPNHVYVYLFVHPYFDWLDVAVSLTSFSL
uniref:Uncharacterized protein n=1 Tax=Rhizophora mucronata TaxID=61149 RepID=A0A2P2M8C2_RHIMU